MTEEELQLRRELRKWELRFRGRIPNQQRLSRLKIAYGRKYGFDALLAIVREVMIVCTQEILAKDLPAYQEAPREHSKKITKDYHKQKRCPRQRHRSY